MENISLRVSQTDMQGKTQHWSADGLFHHLSLLKALIPDQVPLISLHLAYLRLLRICQCNPALTESFINAYFYRVTAMLPSELRMVLKLARADTTIPLTNNLGTMHWIAMSTSSLFTASKFNSEIMFAVLSLITIDCLLENPYLTERKQSSQISLLFVAEREEDNIYSTIREMHKWASIMG